jgi:hypothetical protein
MNIRFRQPGHLLHALQVSSVQSPVRYFPHNLPCVYSFQNCGTYREANEYMDPREIALHALGELHEAVQ